jgi:hypothetical protein
LQMELVWVCVQWLRDGTDHNEDDDDDNNNNNNNNNMLSLKCTRISAVFRPFNPGAL